MKAILITGGTDFIGSHVCDLADGHVPVLDYLNRVHSLLTLNLGTGADHLVLEIVKTFEKVSGCDIPYKIGLRRARDIAKCWADTMLAQQQLNWKATVVWSKYLSILGGGGRAAWN